VFWTCQSDVLSRGMRHFERFHQIKITIPILTDATRPREPSRGRVPSDLSRESNNLSLQVSRSTLMAHPRQHPRLPPVRHPRRQDPVVRGRGSMDRMRTDAMRWQPNNPRARPRPARTTTGRARAGVRVGSWVFDPVWSRAGQGGRRAEDGPVSTCARALARRWWRGRGRGRVSPPHRDLLSRGCR
jgi:hypothetical protein